MKILIIGDTHKKLDKALTVMKRVKGIDLFIHTGDYYEDAVMLSEQTGIPFVGVKGNCDGSVSSDDCATVDTEYGKIFVAHGHMHNSYDKLIYAAKERGCIAAVFGHIHVPHYEEEDGFYILNPGSLTRPRDNTEGSYIVLTTSKKTFNPAVVYYRDDFSSAKGGFIRRILNFSDRF